MEKKQEAILQALENLTADGLQRFNLKLEVVALPHHYQNIPRVTVGPLSVVDLTNKLVTFYSEDFGANLMANLLLDTGLHQKAERLLYLL